jgi:hypothetical protein
MRQVSTSAISDVLETLPYSTIAAPHPHYHQRITIHNDNQRSCARITA